MLPMISQSSSVCRRLKQRIKGAALELNSNSVLFKKDKIDLLEICKSRIIAARKILVNEKVEKLAHSSRKINIDKHSREQLFSKAYKKFHFENGKFPMELENLQIKDLV